MGQRKDHSAHMQKVDALGKGQGFRRKFRRMEVRGQWTLASFSGGAQDGPTTNFECCIHRALVPSR